MSPAGLRTQYEIPKSAIRNNYFVKAKISEIEEKNILPCIFKKNIEGGRGEGGGRSSSVRQVLSREGPLLLKIQEFEEFLRIRSS